MKSKTLTILALSLMAAPIFCGNNNSTPATKTIRLADTETLTDAFKKEYSKEKEKKEIDNLISKGYMDPFAGKEFSDKKDIERTLDTTLNAILKEHISQIEEIELLLRNEAFKEEKKAIQKKHKKNCKEKKSTILRLLLESSKRIEV